MDANLETSWRRLQRAARHDQPVLPLGLSAPAASRTDERLPGLASPATGPERLTGLLRQIQEYLATGPRLPAPAGSLPTAPGNLPAVPRPPLSPPPTSSSAGSPPLRGVRGPARSQPGLRPGSPQRSPSLPARSRLVPVPRLPTPLSPQLLRSNTASPAVQLPRLPRATPPVRPPAGAAIEGIPPLGIGPSLREPRFTGPVAPTPRQPTLIQGLTITTPTGAFLPALPAPRPLRSPLTAPPPAPQIAPLLPAPVPETSERPPPSPRLPDLPVSLPSLAPAPSQIPEFRGTTTPISPLLDRLPGRPQDSQAPQDPSVRGVPDRESRSRPGFETPILPASLGTRSGLGPVPVLPVPATPRGTVLPGTRPESRSDLSPLPPPQLPETRPVLPAAPVGAPAPSARRRPWRIAPPPDSVPAAALPYLTPSLPSRARTASRQTRSHRSALRPISREGVRGSGPSAAGGSKGGRTAALDHSPLDEALRRTTTLLTELNRTLEAFQRSLETASRTPGNRPGGHGPLTPQRWPGTGASVGSSILSDVTAWSGSTQNPNTTFKF